MITMNEIKNFFKGEYSLKDIIDYFRGMYRYHLYYSKFKFLIRFHIKEQISFRIEVMDKVCYNQGTCKLCGCMVTALQMANKMCDKPCYPVMMNKMEWHYWKKEKMFIDRKHRILWKQTKTKENIINLYHKNL